MQQGPVVTIHISRKHLAIVAGILFLTLALGTVIGGTINGGIMSGAGIVYTGSVPDGGGDKIFAIRSGKNLLFKGIAHVTGGHFVYLLNDCENVGVHDIRIRRSRLGVRTACTPRVYASAASAHLPIFS